MRKAFVLYIIISLQLSCDSNQGNKMIYDSESNLYYTKTIINDSSCQFTFYDTNKVKTDQTNYVNHKMNGDACKYFANGAIKVKMPYIDNNADGNAIFYDSLGNITSTAQFKNDQLHGIQIEFDKNGDTIQVVKHFEDRLISRTEYCKEPNIKANTIYNISKDMQKVVCYNRKGEITDTVHIELRGKKTTNKIK